MSAPLTGLQRHFGFEGFRPGQLEIIESVLSGRNTVAVMPTGAGKSLCYQLPATLLDGLTLVVSPLISLMADQVAHLAKHQVPAAALNSSQSDAQNAATLEQAQQGALKLLYVAPERLRSERLLSALEGRVALLAIDEAHCISVWGHDFRPDYAQLGHIRKRLRPPRSLAVTATATPEVRKDIIEVLLLKDPQVFVKGFDRPNLFLEVVPVDGDEEKQRRCTQLAQRHGSGLVYCSTRRAAENLHQALLKRSVAAVLYHAGMSDEQRAQAQQLFMSTPGTVAVATNAFGMGIDKPDIRFVAHAGIPRAVEAYYQEIGRAGRDGKLAHAVLLFNHADVYTQQRLIQAAHPTRTLIADVWHALQRNTHLGEGVARLAARLGANEQEVSAAVRILERGGFLTRRDRGEGDWTFSLASGSCVAKPRSAAARAVLHELRERMPEQTPTTLPVESLTAGTSLGVEQVREGLKLLEKSGWVTIRRPFSGRTLTTTQTADFEDLGIDLAHIRALERRAMLLLRRMTDYAYSRNCRRAFILRYFGDPVGTGRCGTCDVCAPAQLSSPPAARDLIGAAPRLGYSLLAFHELSKWRRELSLSLNIAPYLIFTDETLKGLAAALPLTREEFMLVRGTGPARWERFGAKVVAASTLARAAGDIAGLPEWARKKARPRRVTSNRSL